MHISEHSKWTLIPLKQTRKEKTTSGVHFALSFKPVWTKCGLNKLALRVDNIWSTPCTVAVVNSCTELHTEGFWINYVLSYNINLQQLSDVLLDSSPWLLRWDVITVSDHCCLNSNFPVWTSVMPRILKQLWWFLSSSVSYFPPLLNPECSYLDIESF